MPRARRILAVTALLLVLGAAGGAVAGGAAATLAGVITFGPRDGLDVALFGFGAAIGAPLGAVLLPLAAWLLLRRVALGRALLGTVLGTVLGGLVGWFLRFGVADDLKRSIATAVVGFLVAVVGLRHSAAARAAASPGAMAA